MKRMSSTFYREVADIRDQYGRTEYDRDQILPAVVGLLRKHEVRDADLMRDAANAILDNIEKAEDKVGVGGQGEMFPYNAQMALGDRKRIRRGSANTEQMWRRKRVIDNNKMGQDQAWANETRWLVNGLDALRGHDISTVLEDVLPQAPPAAGAAGEGSHPA